MKTSACASASCHHGIPLPFISYGGTNLVVNMAGVGLVLNVTQHKSSVDLKTKRS